MKTLLRTLTALFVSMLLLSAGIACADETRLIPVSLEGGSGKARVMSPAEIRENENGLTAVLQWSSSRYDYMVVDGIRYDAVSTEGGSVFEIPIPCIPCSIAVQADTLAMGTPHLIDYILTFGEQTINSFPDEKTTEEAYVEPDGLGARSGIGLQWAKQLHMDALESGGYLITIADTDCFLLLPENIEKPADLPPSISILRQPLLNIYLSASGVMEMFIDSGALDSLRFSSLKQGDWTLEAAADAMAQGKLVYAGKYSAPDYELLSAGGCDLAIENRMLTHAPKTAEMLRALGIPVLIDYSSYEATPQGRMEWIKLYGLLTGHYEEASAAFERQIAVMEPTERPDDERPKTAFFYVTSNGQISVRCASDYIPYLIRAAGGKYIFDSYGTDALSSTMLIQPEVFCAEAYDADYLIYNSTIGGEVRSLQELEALCPLFPEMKAFREGNVFQTSRDLYQSSMQMGTLMRDFALLFGGTEETVFLHRLK